MRVNVALLTVLLTDTGGPRQRRAVGARGQPGGRDGVVAPRWTPVETRPAARPGSDRGRHGQLTVGEAGGPGERTLS